MAECMLAAVKGLWSGKQRAWLCLGETLLACLNCMCVVSAGAMVLLLEDKQTCSCRRQGGRLRTMSELICVSCTGAKWRRVDASYARFAPYRDASMDRWHSA